MAAASNSSRSRMAVMACKASSPYRPTRRTSRPKRRPLPANPARRKGRRSIFPIPAAHPSTLYGMGENAAMNTPARPYRSSSTSRRARLRSCLKRVMSGRPQMRPSVAPASAPRTLLTVATTQIARYAPVPEAAAAIGRISTSGGIGCKAASVKANTARPTRPAEEAASRTVLSHPTWFAASAHGKALRRRGLLPQGPAGLGGVRTCRCSIRRRSCIGRSTGLQAGSVRCHSGVNLSACLTHACC